MLNELFKFPIVMIDGDNEERKAAENRLIGKEMTKVEENMI